MRNPDYELSEKPENTSIIWARLYRGISWIAAISFITFIYLAAQSTKTHDEIQDEQLLRIIQENADIREELRLLRQEIDQ